MLALLALLSASVSGTVNSGAVETIFEFSRKLDTCDDKDVAIQADGTTQVIYAYSDSDEMKKHTVKGSRSLRLTQEHKPFQPVETDVRTTEVRYENYSVPFDDPHTGPATTYYCMGFKLDIPQGEKVHMIRWEPLISPAMNEGTVHHMLLYDCGFLSNASIDYRGHCYSSSTPSEISQCNNRKVVAGWAVGGVDTVFPSNIGYPLGEDENETYARYLLLEIHYDNMQQREVVDSSGFRLTYTSQLREHDAGTFNFGSATDSSITIPANQAGYEYNTWCPGVCTESLLSAGAVNLFGGLLHAHTAGRSMSLRHARNGTELDPILVDKNYDFNLQDFLIFDNETVLLPGDTLYTQCVYNTQGRSSSTRFGLSTSEEMCLAYVLYYPRIKSSDPSCLYANVSGDRVYCNGVALTGANVTFTPIANPRPTPNCTYTGVPTNHSTAAVLRGIESFDALSYNRREFLDVDQNVLLHWSIDRENQIARFALEVVTSGWVGIGISTNKGMVGSDIAMGWVKDGDAFAFDRFAEAKSLPSDDNLQDLFSVFVSEGIPGFAEPQNDPGTAAWKIYVPILAGLGLLLIFAAVIRARRRSRKPVFPTGQDKYGAIGVATS